MRPVGSVAQTDALYGYALRAYQEAKHKRKPKGDPRGGEYTEKPGNANAPPIEFNPEDWELDENEDLLAAVHNIGGVDGVRLVMESKPPPGLQSQGEWEAGMVYSHGENTIYVYPPAFSHQSSIDLDGQLAHEVMHHYHAVAEGKGREKTQDFWEPHGEALNKTKGLTAYSQKVWMAWRDGKVSLHTAIQEELAEMYRIGYDEPERLKQRASPEWLDFYALVLKMGRRSPALKGYDETKHRRKPKGDPQGGEFADKMGKTGDVGGAISPTAELLERAIKQLPSPSSGVLTQRGFITRDGALHETGRTHLDALQDAVNGLTGAEKQAALARIEELKAIYKTDIGAESLAREANLVRVSLDFRRRGMLLVEFYGDHATPLQLKEIADLSDGYAHLMLERIARNKDGSFGGYVMERNSEQELRNLSNRQVLARFVSAWRRSPALKAYEEQKHPRAPKGHPDAGEWAGKPVALEPVEILTLTVGKPDWQRTIKRHFGKGDLAVSGAPSSYGVRGKILDVSAIEGAAVIQTTTGKPLGVKFHDLYHLLPPDQPLSPEETEQRRLNRLVADWKGKVGKPLAIGDDAITGGAFKPANQRGRVVGIGHEDNPDAMRLLLANGQTMDVPREGLFRLMPFAEMTAIGKKPLSSPKIAKPYVQQWSLFEQDDYAQPQLQGSSKDLIGQWAHNQPTAYQPYLPSPTASDVTAWLTSSAPAVFAEGGALPDVLNDVPFSEYIPPAEWSQVEGYLDINEPPLTMPAARDYETLLLDKAGQPLLDLNTGNPMTVKKHGVPNMHPAAGVIIEEPDGRIWTVMPRNEYGGYKQTFLKGTVEAGQSLQEAALREAWEESGLRVVLTGVLGDFEGDTSITRYYTARRAEGKPTLSKETWGVSLAPLEELGKLLNRSRDQAILDAVKTRRGIATKAAGRYDEVKHPRAPKGHPKGGKWVEKIGGGASGKPQIIRRGTATAEQEKVIEAVTTAIELLGINIPVEFKASSRRVSRVGGRLMSPMAQYYDGRITVFVDDMDAKQAAGILAHEYTHHRWIKKGFDVAVDILFDDEKMAKELERSDGVTSYSRTFWRERHKKGGSSGWLVAVNETLAEISRLKIEKGSPPLSSAWTSLYNKVMASRERK